MAFDQAAAQRFFAEPQVAVFAVAASGGPPAAVPLWYRYEPGGAPWIVVGTATRKARLVLETRTATLVAEAVRPRIRFVSVELALLDARHPTVEDFRDLASPHLDDEHLDGFLHFARGNLEHELKMTFEVSKWRFGDLTPG